MFYFLIIRLEPLNFMPMGVVSALTQGPSPEGEVEQYLIHGCRPSEVEL